MKIKFALLYIISALAAVEVADDAGAALLAGDGASLLAGNGAAFFAGDGAGLLAGDGAALADGNFAATAALGGGASALLAQGGAGLASGMLVGNLQNVNLQPRVMTQRVMAPARVITEQKVEPVYQRIVNRPMIERERFQIVPQYVR